MTAKANATVLAAVAVVALVIACCTLLVALDKVSGNDFMLVVVGPLIGAAVTFVAGVKGVQQGSKATSDPPPGA